MLKHTFISRVMFAMLAACCVLPLTHLSTVHAAGLSQILLSQQSASQLKLLNLQLNLELEALGRAEDKLVSAENQFEATSAELNAAKAEAEANPHPESKRRVRIINVRYLRHKDKVERTRERIQSARENIDNLRSKLAEMEGKPKKASAKPAKTQSSNVKPKENLAGLTSKKNLQVASANSKVGYVANKQTAVKAPTKKAVVATPRAKTADWPYLSNAKQADKAFAIKRLAELKKMTNRQLKREAPLSDVEVKASSSFGSASMEYIGGNLFSVVANVKSGRQLFEIFDLKEWHTIPESDHKKAYRILFDVSSISEPRLILFNNELLKQ